jgi:hypothetical protein
MNTSREHAESVIDYQSGVWVAKRNSDWICSRLSNGPSKAEMRTITERVIRAISSGLKRSEREAD